MRFTDEQLRALSVFLYNAKARERVSTCPITTSSGARFTWKILIRWLEGKIEAGEYGDVHRHILNECRKEFHEQLKEEFN